MLWEIDGNRECLVLPNGLQPHSVLYDFGRPQLFTVEVGGGACCSFMLAMRTMTHRLRD